MKKFSYIKESESVDINISPLIDMMFLLLIFFVVTTAFVEEIGVEIQKPKAMSASTLEKKSIMLGITAKGEVRYAGREIALNSVRGLVSRLLKTYENVPVIIYADENCMSGRLVDVIDECKLAGAKIVSIATEKE